MIFSANLDSVDFDLLWPSALQFLPTITVYDVSGTTVANASVDRSATTGPSFTTEAVRVVSPVPIGRIKIGPVGAIFYLDNIVF